MKYTTKYVETALRGIAAERPDQINPLRDDGAGCAYNGADGSHCIAGQFLSNEGYEIPASKEGIGARHVAHDLGMELTHGAENLLFDAQLEADLKVPWGEAIQAVIR